MSIVCSTCGWIQIGPRFWSGEGVRYHRLRRRPVVDRRVLRDLDAGAIDRPEQVRFLGVRGGRHAGLDATEVPGADVGLRPAEGEPARLAGPATATHDHHARPLIAAD